jgi:hypothetical protein
LAEGAGLEKRKEKEEEEEEEEKRRKGSFWRRCFRVELRFAWSFLLLLMLS